MELFLFHFRQTGNTVVEQVFVGTSAFDTIEPANLEALLSTKSRGIRATNKPNCIKLPNSKQTSISGDGERSHFPCLERASSHKKVQHGRFSRFITSTASA